MDNLTEKQKQLLNFIIDYKISNDGNSPTVRQVMAGMGMSSTSGTNSLIASLVEAGYLEHAGKKSRSIRVVGGKYIPPTYI